MHRHYIRQKGEKRPVRALAVATVLLAAALAAVINLPPVWWLEIGVVAAVTAAIFLTGAWMGKRKKWGVVASLGVAGLLLMNRWQVLDEIFLGLWLLVLVVIALVN